jgi:hypothetical protein
MSGVSIKTEIGPVDGTPEKRMFWSIISDYDLKTGLCELIDNALDIWVSSDKKKIPTIEIDLDVDQQLISVKDNVGGVKFEDLSVLLAPGGSENDPKAAVIGILRNKLVHERATVDVLDRDTKNYRSVVGKILKILFDLNFSKL